ncbi:hypothetical protein [Lacisediminihabitans sp.]|uniref:hypothetical protein n=1 Tax=Lacisediminihabitans sp. TaxID=2787631 RepID=UPI00374D1581
MDLSRAVRQVLTWVLALVAVSAIAGGVALIIGSVSPDLATVLSPPTAYLTGSPFSSYLVPGILLAVLVGGLHGAAFVLTFRRERWHLLAAATCGYEMLIWIFVQMVFIPFSPLQVAYIVIGMLEVGLVLVLLGLFSPAATNGRRHGLLHIEFDVDAKARR